MCNVQLYNVLASIKKKSTRRTRQVAGLRGHGPPIGFPSSSSKYTVVIVLGGGGDGVAFATYTEKLSTVLNDSYLRCLSRGTRQRGAEARNISHHSTMCVATLVAIRSLSCTSPAVDGVGAEELRVTSTQRLTVTKFAHVSNTHDGQQRPLNLEKSVLMKTVPAVPPAVTTINIFGGPLPTCIHTFDRCALVF